jgi:hypothetical protein
VVWPSIDDLVRGSGQRSYLKEYRSWLQVVLDEFAFLEAFGYSLPRDELKGVHFHFRGNYVWFQGPSRDVVIEYDPESEFIMANLWEDEASTAGRFTSLDQALLATGSAGEPPGRSPLDRAAIEETIRWWANGLRANATDLLRLSSEWAVSSEQRNIHDEQSGQD